MSKQNKFGFFDDKAKEYVITTPQTPHPWINYLGNERFFSLISNTAGGYSFYKDARLRRITRYRYNNVPIDMGGRYFYINDGENVWNPGWSPVKAELASYECRHGMGYTRIKSSKNGIGADVLFFVPNDFDGEVQKVRLTNHSETRKTIKLFSLAEWCLWDAQDDTTNFQRNFNTGEVEIRGRTRVGAGGETHKNYGNLIVHRTEYKERRNHYAFYGVNASIDGFDTDREKFLGTNYNGFHNPQTVFDGEPNNSIAEGWSPIASHYIEVELGAGESKEFVFVLGYAENEQDEKFEENGMVNLDKAYDMMERFDTPEKVDEALAGLKSYWGELLSIITVQSPDEKLNRMVNIWNQYQCMVTFNMSRSASYFESGIGRGMGFRDSNQDILGFVHQIPERARQRILDLAATMLEDGGCYHQFQPLTGKGNHDIGGNFSDDPLWMIMSTVAYIKETGDKDILNEMVPYDNDESKAETLMHHLQQCYWRVYNNRGPHGLPLAMRADWNDCLNLSCDSMEPGQSFQTYTSPKYGEEGFSKVAESVFVGVMFSYVGPEFLLLCQEVGMDDEAEKVEKAFSEMDKALLEYGWDGEWFLRAYDANGDKVGSHENEEGKIFIEPQGFAVLAGLHGGDGKDIQALDSVDKYLNTKHGLVLNNPGFTKYYPELGEISTYPAGYKENAGIFCHNNAWMICAEAHVGRGDKAFEYYSKIAPAYREDISDLHRTEPYVYAQMIAGKDADRHGEAKNSWLTGTAAWNFVAVSQYILGIKPDYDGLEINPCIPKEWDRFTAVRKFRGATYEITVENPHNVSKGVAFIEVDGKRLANGGIVIPVFNDGKTHTVRITLG